MLYILIYICAGLAFGFEIYAGLSDERLNIPALVAGSLFGVMALLIYLESRRRR